MRDRFFIFVVFCSILAASCTKHSPINCFQCPPVFDRVTLFQPPYDTSALNGTLIAAVHNNLNCCVLTTYSGIILYDSFAVRPYLVADTFVLHWDEIAELRNMQGHFKTNIDSVFWRFGLYTYNDVARQPHHHCILPDTVNRSSGTTLVVDSVSNADTIGVMVYVTNNPHIERNGYFSARNGTITMDTTFFNVFDTTSGLSIIVSTFHHQFVTRGAFQYLFVKQFDVEKQFTFR